MGDKEGWKDSDGDDCDTYKGRTWCEDGDVGLGWHEEWGSLDDFVEEGTDSAKKACCACGGGLVPVVKVEVASKQLVIGIVTTLVLVCVFAITTIYYRKSYNEIKYGKIGATGSENARNAPDDI